MIIYFIRVYQIISCKSVIYDYTLRVSDYFMLEV